MKIYQIAAAALLLTFLAGCQSASWMSSLGTKFRRDKPSQIAKDSKETPKDVELVSGDRRNRAGRRNSRSSADDRRIAGAKQPQGDVAAILRRGHKAEEIGQLKQAKMFYRQALDSEPKNPLAHHRLAIIADKEGEFRQAEEHYLNALGVRRDDPNLLSDLGYSFLLQNRKKESKYYLEKALEADPSHLRALNNLGLLEARQGNYDGALAMFRKTGSERDAQAKMSELFPNGRIAQNDVAPPIGSTTPGSRQPLPQVTPAGGAAAWEQGGSRAPIQTLGSSPTAPPIPDSPAARPFPQSDNLGRPNQVAGFNEPAAPQSNVPANSFPDVRQQGNPFAAEPPRSNASLPLDSGQPASDSLSAVPIWPNSNSKSDGPSQQRDLPVAPDPAGLAREFGRPNQQQEIAFGQGRRSLPSATSPNSNHPPTNPGPLNNFNPGQPGAQSELDPRQQAAMMGLNAGIGGAFPVTHGGQPRQPHNPAANPGDSGQGIPQPPHHQPARPMDTSPPFPAQTTGQFGRPTGRFPAQQSHPPTSPGDNRFRTAARPVSPPAGDFYQQQQQYRAPSQPTNQPHQQPLQPQHRYQAPAQQPARNGTFGQPDARQPQQYPQLQQAPPTQQYNPQRPVAQPPTQSYRDTYDTNHSRQAPQQFNPNNQYQPGR